MKYQEIAKQKNAWEYQPYKILTTFSTEALKSDSEVCHRKGIQLLLTPLGFGVLTGKYINQTADSRPDLLLPDYKRIQMNMQTAKKYMEIANDYNLSLTQLSLQFVTSRPFFISNIIGATKIEQLKENIRSFEVEMSDELLARIQEVHKNHPNPSP